MCSFPPDAVISNNKYLERVGLFDLSDAIEISNPVACLYDTHRKVCEYHIKLKFRNFENISKRVNEWRHYIHASTRTCTLLKSKEIKYTCAQCTQF